MTDEQRKMIDKLNEDNRKLNDVNKGMKDYAKYKLVVWQKLQTKEYQQKVAGAVTEGIRTYLNVQ